MQLVVEWELLYDTKNASNYIISYSNTENTDCFTITDIPGNETMYPLTGLEVGTEYSITVTATLSDGETGEDSLTAVG